MKFEAGLKVPIARDTANQLVRPEDAATGTMYRCPSCSGEVYVRGGTARVRVHFAHRSYPDVCDFMQETEEHWLAKERICEIVRAGTPIVLVRRCGACHVEGTQTILPGGCIAAQEHLLSTDHRADVALIEPDGHVRMAIEIYATHAVPPEKVVALREIPWIELNASDVLRCDAAAPVLYPIRAERSAFQCLGCQEWKEFARVRPFVGPRFQNVQCPLKGGGEVVAVETCARCEHFDGAAASGVTCLGLRAANGTA